MSLSSRLVLPSVCLNHNLLLPIQFITPPSSPVYNILPMPIATLVACCLFESFSGHFPVEYHFGR